ncbi:MAG: heavy-metal-associated domain-containing protein [Bacteroidales bacterium]|nr:heavy-metal-associated domain-containing protein [Bacteroidales bacterium]
MKSKLLTFILFLIATFMVHAQNKSEIKIKTSAQCGMCKERIEKALAYEKGIYSSNLDLKTKEVTVVYNPQKTSPDKIRLAISKVGYQADDLKADPFAYEELPPCCKLPDDKNHQEHQN